MSCSFGIVRNVKRKGRILKAVGSAGQKRVTGERDIPLASHARLLSKQERMLQ